MAVSGDILVIETVGTLLAASGRRPEMLLTLPHSAAPPHNKDLSIQSACSAEVDNACSRIKQGIYVGKIYILRILLSPAAVLSG